MPDVQHKRGTRAALDALAGAGGLLVGQIYLITDEDRLAVATSVGAYETYAKQSEVGATAPTARDFISVSRDNTSPVTMVNAFTNLALPIETSDAGNLWDGTFYTVQQSGFHVIDASLRIADSTSAGKTVGFGVHTTTADFVGFGWFAARGSMRNVFFYHRGEFFTAGQKLRLFHHSDSAGVVVNNAAMQIYRLTT